MNNSLNTNISNVGEGVRATSTDLRSPVDALSGMDLSDYSHELLQTYDIQSGGSSKDASLALYARQGFRIGRLGLMIGYADGSELIDIPKLHHIPNAPAWFVGVTNLHGMVIPVFDLGIYLGAEHSKQKQQRLLVLGQGNDAAAVIIDGLPDRLHWHSGQQVEKQTAPQKLQAHIRTACLIDGQLWFDLDSASLCQSLEAVLQGH